MEFGAEERLDVLEDGPWWDLQGGLYVPDGGEEGEHHVEPWGEGSGENLKDQNSWV